MFDRVRSSPNSGRYGDWSPGLLTQDGQAVVQVRFTNRPQQSDSDRQGMPARNCKGRSVLQGSRIVQRPLSRGAAAILTPAALIRSSQGAASRRKSRSLSTIARRSLRPVTPSMSLTAGSSSTFISASVFLSRLPAAYRHPWPVWLLLSQLYRTASAPERGGCAVRIHGCTTRSMPPSPAAAAHWPSS